MFFYLLSRNIGKNVEFLVMNYVGHNLVINYSKKIHKNDQKCDLIYRESVR